MSRTAQEDTAQYVTINEAAKLLGVHPNTVRTRVKRGLLPSNKVMTLNGEAYMIPVDRVTPPSPPSQDGGRVYTGSNDLLPSFDAGNEAIPTLTSDPHFTLTTVNTLFTQLVTPLVEINARQAEELSTLHTLTRHQAEEIGQERGRREAAEQEAERLRRVQRSRPWWVRLFLG